MLRWSSLSSLAASLGWLARRASPLCAWPTGQCSLRSAAGGHIARPRERRWSPKSSPARAKAAKAKATGTAPAAKSPKESGPKKAELKMRDVRMSHRKLNLVCRLIRRLHVAEAERQLSVCRKKGARVLSDLLAETKKVAQEERGMDLLRTVVDESYVAEAEEMPRHDIVARAEARGDATGAATGDEAGGRQAAGEAREESSRATAVAAGMGTASSRHRGVPTDTRATAVVDRCNSRRAAAVAIAVRRIAAPTPWTAGRGTIR
eukprot:ctg_698.g347